MPANKYKLEDFQSWIEHLDSNWGKMSMEARRQVTAREATTAVDLGMWNLIWNTETSSFNNKPSSYTNLDGAFLTCCDVCCRKYDADHPNELRVGSVVPDDSCLNANCLSIKNVWKHCVQNRDFRILNGVEGWNLHNRLGETAHDVILKWMDEVDNKEKIRSLEQKEEFNQNQMILAPKKY